ncbi:unannotated protein [freshwater metagenome]|uniref:Unannotated protein n=1 Tax=freshwater metagenome TaxID=449393 RepID=A0A6J6ZLK9_9ZZZZ
MIFRPAARRARPVSVMSTTQSAMSGIFASLAPYESRMSAEMPRSAKKRLVSSGYSLVTRTPCGRSRTEVAVESPATATTTFTGLLVAFEYFSSPRLSTLLEVSSTQSRPVIPMSNRPSAT